jgi:cell division protease FtsH
MNELKDNLAMTLGGRAAEEVVFGEITTGAANDIEKATAVAKQMIMRYGMSEELGPRTLGHNQALPFLGREFSQEPDYSEEVARQIDAEIRRILEDAHECAKTVLNEHREQLDAITSILISRETLERSEFEALLEGASEEDVFHEKDERQRERAQVQKPKGRRERTTQPKVVTPAPVPPINPETT